MTWEIAGYILAVILGLPVALVAVLMVCVLAVSVGGVVLAAFLSWFTARYSDVLG